MNIFEKGIAIDDLVEKAKALALKLDKNELVPREDPKLQENRRLEVEELKFGLANLDAFRPEDQSLILELARIFGISREKAPPKKWMERSAPDQKWTTGYLDAVALGDYVFVSDRRQGVLRYDTINDQWFQIPKPNFGQPYFRWQSSGIGTFQGQLVSVGTYPNQSDQAWGAVRLYDPNTGRISALPNCRHRANCGVAEHDGQLYVFGGSRFSSEQSVLYGTPIDSVQAYDPASNTWRDLPPLPEARYGCKAVAFEDKIYVIGGRSANGSSKRIDVFDTVTQQWQAPLEMASPRLNPTAWIEDGKLHISGGQNVHGLKINDYRSHGQVELEHVDASTEILDPRARTLTQGATSPFNGKDAGVIALTADGRKFAFSLDDTSAVGYASGPRTEEHVVPEGMKPHTVVNYVDNSTTVNVDIDVLVKSLRKNVTNIEIEEHNHITIALPHQDRPLDFDVLKFCNTGNQILASDGEFYCRKSYEGRELIRVACDDDGRRFLVGDHAGTKLPLPKNENFVLYHRDADRQIPFSTDAKGRFAVPIDDLRGEAFIVRIDREARSQGVAIKLT